MIQPENKQTVMGWLKESVTVKLIFIGMLTIVLLIPSVMIGDLIKERAGRQAEMIAKVTDQWSGSQMIKGPVLVIPYKRMQNFSADSKETPKEIIENLYVLPDNLKISASVNSDVLHRGIFDAVVYNTIIKVSGNFSKANLAALALSPEQLMPGKAKLIFGISDLKGLKNNPVINAGGQLLSVEPAYDGHALFDNGLQTAINLTPFKDGAFKFKYTLDLKGSQELHFLHLGKTTDVQVSGNWPGPSFDGRYLPDTRKVDKNGFSARWHMLYYNRPYPQQWVADDTLLNNNKKAEDASFGVKLLLPVDQYQKITRTSKYAILIILLTFVSLFLTEVIQKKRIHVFNYILIGAAMIIYYTLLLSFSEQVGYNWAYVIASVATIGLITTFIASLLKNTKAAMLFAFILSVFYTFIFVIIQLEDMALLIGSVALFIITGVLMYFSRKINWDNH
ncbi:cell envelope integrity protein CreD [Mucilaginibacter segetis]|uniref:Cell envelope integrity protein CreD n=1 Tax=Mucilaginibacter segetis TaxID=2793071 RepID=A0A934UNX7_9SPHI|nr:cell envelope integrity protein CreD [Mucilaginibacter segetis]MBK0381263.1 cell envelope integrity protein CreD [Mucilaginibacter segetis]